MKYLLTPEAEREIASRYEETVALLKELCQIPAPSNHEEKRAAWIRDWLENLGAQGVYIDEALNVVYPVNCENRNDIVVFMAHTDTVFPDTEPMPMKEENGRLYCPGVGDDTANVAVLLTTVKYIIEKKLRPACGMLFVLNSGEEGLGNLKGCRQLMKDYEGRVASVISLDGGITRYCNKSVGSHRYLVEIKTEGGHSYGSFGNRNAIAVMSNLINALYSVKVPVDGDSKTTYNVGTVSGGTSVNTIAQRAAMLYEYRSDSKVCIDKMEKMFYSLIDAYRNMGVEIDVRVLGKRPCMGVVDPRAQEALEERFSTIMAAYNGGIVPKAGSGSTDCNIPFSMGIPSICFGGYSGCGAHTREESIELKSLIPGLKIVTASVLSYFRG